MHFVLFNQSADSSILIKQKQPKWLSELCFPALVGAGYIFPTQTTLNAFGLVSGAFTLTTNQGFLSSYSLTYVCLFNPSFNLFVKNTI